MERRTYGDFEEGRIKHLDMIQAVIARLGTDSFLVKGWALTVAGAFFGFAINATNPGLAWTSIVPSVLFWTLDTHFLRAERLFRVLFEYVRRGSTDIDPMFMSATGATFLTRVKADEDQSRAASWWHTFKRPTLRYFYGILIVMAILLVLLIETHAPVLQPQPLPSASP